MWSQNTWLSLWVDLSFPLGRQCINYLSSVNNTPNVRKPTKAWADRLASAVLCSIDAIFSSFSSNAFTCETMVDLAACNDLIVASNSNCACKSSSAFDFRSSLPNFELKRQCKTGLFCRLKLHFRLNEIFRAKGKLNLGSENFSVHFHNGLLVSFL